MTIEMEDRLVSELKQIDDRKRALIRKIVEASLAGIDASEDLASMNRLSKRKSELTRPSFSAAA